MRQTMQPFTFHTPTKISFGEDTASGVGELLVEFGGTQPLLVTDANLQKAGVLTPILLGLKDSGIGEPVIFDRVPADSDIACVREAVDAARKSGCDCVIAVGGGSVLDTAKVANIGLTLEGDVLDYEGMNTLAARLLPLIAVPTTAGTGSEVSAVAMIKDHEQQKKMLFGSRFLFPDAAVLDPKLLVSLPPRLTAATGLDALTHAIESFVAMTKNSPSDALCLEAMKLIFSNLPRATKDGADLDARSAMLVGSMMAGLSFTNAGVGIVHALAHSFGGKFGTHHGVTNAIFLPYGMEYNLENVADKFEMAYNYLCVVMKSAPEPARSWFEAPGADSAKKLIEAVRELNKVCGIPARLRDINVPELSDADIAELAEGAITDPALMFNPKPASEEDLADIIKRAY
jgi:alcohol dehydrogenase class IV